MSRAAAQAPTLQNCYHPQGQLPPQLLSSLSSTDLEATRSLLPGQQPQRTVWPAASAWVLKPALILLQEKEPMGTAGPLALARDILDDGSGDPFFVLNRCGHEREWHLWLVLQSQSILLLCGLLHSLC